MRKELTRTKKNRILFGSGADIANWFVALLGVAATCFGFFNSNSVWVGLIIAVASQIIAVCAWGISIKWKYWYNAEINKKEESISEFNTKIEQLQNEVHTLSEKAKQDNKRQIGCFKQASDILKDNGNLYHKFLLLVASTTEIQYENTEMISKMDISEGEKQRYITQQAERYISELISIFNRYCRNTIDNIIKEMEILLDLRGKQQKLAVAIKLFVNPFNDGDKREDAVIYTVFRDPTSYKEKKREIGKTIFHIDKSSSFQHCLSKDFYIVNNIKDGDPSYMNEHDEYGKYYNCSVMVPIRIGNKDPGYKFFGFICVDCLNQSQDEIFGSIEAINLFNIAQDMAVFLETIESNWFDRFEDWQLPLSLFEEIYHRTNKTNGS